MAHTHTLLWSLFFFFFKCAAGISASFFFFFFLLAGIALQDDVHGDVSSFFPSLSPIFWLAQILQIADLGDEPEHPLEVAVQPAGAGRHWGAATTDHVGRTTLPPARISKRFEPLTPRPCVRPSSRCRNQDSNPRSFDLGAIMITTRPRGHPPS